MEVNFPTSTYNRKSSIVVKQARKGFRPQCDVENWIFSKSKEFFEKLLGSFFWKNFFGGSFWKEFFGGFFREDFFGRNFWEDFFGRNSLGGILTLLKSGKLL